MPEGLRSDIVVDQSAAVSPIHAMLARIERAGPESADRLNAIANHEAVLPFISAGLSSIDMSPLLADQRNAILLGEHGFMLFTPGQPFNMIYEAHTSVLPEGRGAWTRTFVLACLHWIFTRTAVAEVFTRCPHLDNVDSTRRLAEFVGGQFLLTNHLGYPHEKGMIPADVFSLPVIEWARTAPGLVERGQWFHRKLEGEYRRLGRVEPNHPDDEAHDRYVGACVDMILAGNIDKGVQIYNRFATMSQYAPVVVMNTEPLLLDIQDAYLIVRGDDFYVHSLKPKPEREEH